MRPRRTVARVLILAAFTVAVSSAPLQPAYAFLDSINPFKDTKDEFEGKFIGTLESRAWLPPLERLEQERLAAGGSNRVSGGKAGEDDSFGDEPASAEPAAEPAEIKIVDGLALLRMTNDWVADIPVLEKYLNGMGARLLEHSPITDAPVRYYVTASQNFGFAKAMPDGVVAIPISVIQKVDTDDELAFILAHEAAHVLLEHHDNDWFQSLNKKFVSAAEMALSMSAGVAEKFGDTRIKQAAILANYAAEAFLFVTDVGLFPSFTREQEDEADLLGLDLMIAAGFNSGEAFTAMEKLKSWQDSAAEAKAKQQAELAAKLEQDAEASANSGDFASAIGGALKRVGLAAKEASDEISETHRDAEARLESLSDYYFREHADDDESPLVTNIALIRIRDNTDVKALSKGYESAWKALSLVKQDDLSGAAKLAGAAVSGRMKNDSLARFAFYRTRLKQGHQGKAITNLEIALKGPRPSLEIYRQLSNMYWGAGRKDESLKVLGWAFDEFGKPPPLYADIIYRHFALGDTKKANMLAIECGVQHRDMRDLCLKAAQGQAPDLAQ